MKQHVIMESERIRLATLCLLRKLVSSHHSLTTSVILWHDIIYRAVTLYNNLVLYFKVYWRLLHPFPITHGTFCWLYLVTTSFVEDIDHFLHESLKHVSLRQEKEITACVSRNVKEKPMSIHSVYIRYPKLTCNCATTLTFLSRHFLKALSH